MTLDASGNLGVGTTSPATRLEINGLSEGEYFRAGGGTISARSLQFSNFTVSGLTGVGHQINVPNASGVLTFATGSTERARITSGGNLLVGKTSSDLGTAGIEIFGAGYGQFTANNDAPLFSNRLGSDGDAVKFYRQTSLVGSISVTASATAYNTSSDYRLKNITGPITNSGAYIDSLKPVEGTWKADGSTFVGLIAHEAQEVSRTEVATGTKDGEEMQAMDYGNSEFIANIIAELQSLRARVAQLEAK